MGKVKVGFIGTGGIAHWHAQQLLETGEAEIVAIADPSGASAQHFLQSHQLADTIHYESYEQMLAAGSLDAVVICSPHTLHFAQARDVLHAGLHVLIEKPMTCNVAEAGQLIALAEELGKVLQVSYQRHFQPEFIYIRDAIASGAIGKLTSINATLYQNWKLEQTNTWRQNPALSGGGMLMDSGSHIADVLLWTTGLTPLEVKSTLATHGAPVEIDSFSSIRFAEGAVAALNIVGYVPGFKETYAFCGEEGVLYLENGQITIHRYDGAAVPVELPSQTTNSDRSFLDAVQGRTEVVVPGTYALKVVQLTEAIYQAAGYKVL